MDLHEIVMKLVGPIDPLGESNADERRLENIQVLTELVDNLLADISSVAHNAGRQEASMKAIGEHASQFLANVLEA